MTCSVGCQFQHIYNDGVTNFTCEQLIEYCQYYEKSINLEKKIDNCISIILLLAGCGGFISYILMLIVFRSPDFNGPSFIYHKSIAWMELIHMFIMGTVSLQGRRLDAKCIGEGVAPTLP